jgi:molybdate transport system substrate-binding protein
LLLLAASDLQTALPEVVERFSAETGIQVTLSFGSTGSFATQIEQGAPADFFLAANEQVARQLAGAGHTTGDLMPYALGRIAVVWDPTRRAVRRLEDLQDRDFETISIANPEHAPFGVAAMEALEASGILESVRSRLVPAENVAQALQIVQSGNTDAGIVALGLIQGQDRPFLLIDENLHRPLRQVGAVISTSARAADARAFLDYLVGPVGAQILGRYGFGAI